MADQPDTASAPQSKEGMEAEDSRVNQPDTAPETPQDTPPEEAKPAQEEDAEPDFDKDDPKTELFAKLDAYNRKVREMQPPLFSEIDPELAGEEGQASAPPKEDATPPPPPPPPEPPKEQTDVQKTLSRAEFLEVFKDFRIKDKVAGEVVEAPVDEWIRGTGLEKHYTKRLMDLSRKERELLDKEKSAPVQVPSDKEIQEKYDELFMESPYKAQTYLKEVEAKKKAPESSGTDETLRARQAYEEFATAYPDVSQEEWTRMNNPMFWQRFPDVVSARERKEWFPTFVLAYNHLQREKLEVERHVVREQLTKKAAAENAQITERKKEGSVIRTTVQPARAEQTVRKALSQEEERREYIKQLQRNARERMNIR